MDFLNISLLSLLQGITELLPISSTGHLILFGKLIDFEMDTYLLSVLHLGTTLALVIYFWSTLTKSIFSKKKIDMYIKIIVSSIPAGIIGLIFQEQVENIFRGNIFIAISLVTWGILMIIIEKKDKQVNKEIKDISWKQSLVMGVSQTLALIPGTSRSGITTIAGVLTGVDKYIAIQYSFLLGLPILLGASIYGIYQGYPQRTISTIEIGGILITAIISLLTLSLLKKFSKSKWLTVFGIYRIILGLLVFVLS